MNDLLLAFYGDDFTGSTDVMEALTLGGVETVLFLQPPQPGQLSGRFANAKVVGVAGISRSMTPPQMDAELPPTFEALKALGAPLFHYKICSTFDSSTDIGSIGHAIDLGQRVFESPFVPLVVGAPALRRYVLFGNLFATVAGEPFRLDRHPTMSRHPITPMDESDLRLHLGKQTAKSIALFDILHLAGTDEQIDEHFRWLRAEGHDVMLFDTLDDRQLPKVGRLIWEHRPLFVVGSSGVEYALAAYWQTIGLATMMEDFASPSAVDRLIVMSGSASPATATQISWALENGFEGIRLDTVKLLDPELADGECAARIEQGLAALAVGKSVVMYSAHGPDDPSITATNVQWKANGGPSIGQRIGEQQGRILRILLEKTGLRRVCVAGGDTSGYVAKQLDIYALEMLSPIAPGSPLCLASSDQSQLDRLEIALKGGQVGKVDYFGNIRAGRVNG